MVNAQLIKKQNFINIYESNIIFISNQLSKVSFYYLYIQK